MTVTAAGGVYGDGAITGSGPVTLANSAAAPIGVYLTSSGNDITGAGLFTLMNTGSFGTVFITNQGNIGLGVSTLTDSSQVTLTAGGIVTLPSGNLTFGSLFVFGNQIDTKASIDYVATDVSLGGNAIGLTGAVNFTGTTTLNIAGDVANTDITVTGSVTTTGPINVDLPAAGQLIIASGTWTQAAGDNLTINGPSATVDIQSGATLSLAGGDSLFLTGEPAGGGLTTSANVLDVQGTLQIAGDNVSDNVTIGDNGSDSIITVNIAGTLLDTLGAAVGVLTLSGANASDQINIESTALLSGSGGLAPAASTAIVQVVGGGIITGAVSIPPTSLANS